MRSFFQIREQGSSAVVSNSLLSSVAVDLGLWSSVDDYIEFNRLYAFYYATNTSPDSPRDFIGSVFPEPSSLGLIASGAIGLGLRRKR